jgi:putative sterol carrier protein
MDITNLDQVDANQLAGAVKSANNDEMVAMLDALGPKAAFDKIFEEMQTRFKPGMAGNIEADVVFAIKHGDDEHTYLVGIHNGTCTTAAGDLEDPKSRLTMSSPTFLKLITGNADGPVSFMSGKLKIKGDIMFTSRLLGFFERPTA